MNGLKNSILSTVSSLAFLGLLSEKAVAQYDSDNNAKLRAIAGIQYQTTGETSIYSQKPISLKAGLQLEGKSGNRMTMFLTASADVPVAGGLGGAWHKHYEDFDHLIVERKNLSDYWQRMSTRKSYTAANICTKIPASKLIRIIFALLFRS